MEPIEYPEAPVSEGEREKTPEEMEKESERERLRLVALLESVRVSRAEMERSGKDGDNG